MTFSRLGLFAITASALVLSGCISLLPKTKPAELYRFGYFAAPAPGAADRKAETPIFRATGAFQRGSASDRLLTITGDQAAYIAGTRWIAPATVLWDEALVAAFDADPGPTRLVSRGEPARSDYLLRLDVRTFEARYDRGAKAAPVVVVRVRGAMLRNKDQSLVGERIFEAQARASENRVSAIVPAYSRAVADVLKDIVGWTNAAVTAG